MGRDSFIFYTDWWEHLQLLDDCDELAVIRAIYAHQHGDDIPDMSDAAKVAFAFIRAQLDRDNERWERIREKRALAGHVGGKETQKRRRQREANACFDKALLNQNEANQAVPVPVPVPVNVPVSVPVPVNESIEADKPPRAQRFTPPTVEEVRQYCDERGNGIDPRHFVDFYEARGWMIGKAKMKSWKAAVRTWEQRDDTNKNEERDYSPASWKGLSI